MKAILMSIVIVGLCLIFLYALFLSCRYILCKRNERLEKKWYEKDLGFSGIMIDDYMNCLKFRGRKRRDTTDDEIAL